MVNDYCGLILDKKKVAEAQSALPFPVFSDVETDIRGTGKGKAILGHKIVKKFFGEFTIRHQKGPSCVSMGAAGACDYTYAYDAIVNRVNYEERLITSTEDIYSGSRVIIGGNQLRGRGGSLGIWAARYVNEWGTLFRKDYGEHDLSTYRYDLETEWADRKIPEYLLEEAGKHKIQTITQVENWEDLCDLLYNGYGVTIASNVGFETGNGQYITQRDKDGFARPRGNWPHQMYLCSYYDFGRRPGTLVVNSWGPKAAGGPTRFENPDGTFWIDPETFNLIAKQGDTWAYSTKIGFPKAKNSGDSIYV